MVYVGVMCLFIETQRIKHGRGYPLIKNPPYISYGARIGSASIIMPGVRIGREAMVAAGSLVTKDCDPFWVYMGRPAKKIRPVPDDEILR
ncbi:2,3,4,5-tetrahydropyridine-2,6-dicarboxylate N-acetyltransferase [subsurface metagenome]